MPKSATPHPLLHRFAAVRVVIGRWLAPGTDRDGPMNDGEWLGWDGWVRPGEPGRDRR